MNVASHEYFENRFIRTADYLFTSPSIHHCSATADQLQLPTGKNKSSVVDRQMACQTMMWLSDRVIGQRLTIAAAATADCRRRPVTQKSLHRQTVFYMRPLVR
jgi:hypothetical protein